MLVNIFVKSNGKQYIIILLSFIYFLLWVCDNNYNARVITENISHWMGTDIFVLNFYCVFTFSPTFEEFHRTPKHACHWVAKMHITNIEHYSKHLQIGSKLIYIHI